MRSKKQFSIEEIRAFKEGHEKIAKFMNMVQHPKYDGWAYKDSVVYEDDGTTIFGADEWYQFYQLKYHSSWTWVHEVLQEIETKGCIVEISYSLICACRICVIGNKREKTFNIYGDNNGGKEPIMAVYNAIIEYINWYNENKK